MMPTLLYSKANSSGKFHDSIRIKKKKYRYRYCISLFFFKAESNLPY